MKMEFNTKENMSDDEEDLESLRLAALQTIKKPSTSVIAPQSNNNAVSASPYKVGKYNGSPQGKRRFQGARQRNGQFNNRVRNSNLIAIPTVPCATEEAFEEKPMAANKRTPFNSSSTEAAPKLVLPQDRYCGAKKVDQGETKTAATTKFSRYDDKSESESDFEEEEEEEVSEQREAEAASPRKLERSDSLEALMQELENEIQGEAKPKVTSPPSPVKVVGNAVKAKKLWKTPSLERVSVTEQKENEPARDNYSNSGEAGGDCDKAVMKRNSPPGKKCPKLMAQRKIKKPSPLKWNLNETVAQLTQPNVFHPPYVPQPLSFQQPFIDGAQLPYNNTPYQAPLSNPAPVLSETLHQQSQQRFIDLQRPLSPLSLSAEVLSTVTMAPLSPRSAAFVLQNREIVERRKRSPPKRSYSRSPSPLSSKSSCGSASRRSRSPPHRHPPSPPKRNDLRKDSPPKGGVRKPPPSRSRLYSSQPGSKTDLTKFAPSGEQKSKRPSKHGNSRSLSPSPERNRLKLSEEGKSRVTGDDPRRKDEKVDPVLEARRRKFENNEIGKKEGLIRLRPKSDKGDLEYNEIHSEITKKSPIKSGTDNAANSLFTEAALSKEAGEKPEERHVENHSDAAASVDDADEQAKDDDESVIDLKVDDLFSDDESDDEENEGRFKAKPARETAAKRNVPILKFTQLLGETKRVVRAEPLSKERTAAKRPRERHHRDRRDRKRPRTRSKTPPPARENRESGGKDGKDKSGCVQKSALSIVSEKKSSAGSDKQRSASHHHSVNNNNSIGRIGKLPVTAPIAESRKIEIKIRNPSKYDDSVAVAKDKRKAAEAPASKETEELPKPQIMVEKEKDGETENDLIDKSEGGDLRAQLSRKRAERQNKYPLTEGVPSRILQNALEGAVFKKVGKIKKTAAPEDDTAPKVDFCPVVNELTTICTYNSNGMRKVHVLRKDLRLICRSSDGKIPIRLRLGGTEKFNDTKTRKKSSRKRKNLSEQV